MSILSKLIAVGALHLFLILFSSTIQAQEKIAIAVGEWPPYISPGQKHNGVISHIIIDIFKDIGIEATLEFQPWSRAYADTAKGMFSATAVWMHKPEREVSFIYSDTVLTERFVFFHKKSLAFDWQSISDLKEFKIGGINASSYGPEFNKALATGEVIINRVIRPQQNFKMLLHDRIQIFPFEVNVGHAMLRSHLTVEEQEQITYHPKAFLNNSSFVLFPRNLKGSQSLSLRFNKQLRKIKDNGKYRPT